jgi:hypothetical protein
MARRHDDEEIYILQNKPYKVKSFVSSKGGTGYSRRALAPRIILYPNTVLENSAVNTVVGTVGVVGVTGTPSYTLVNNAGGRFKIVGNSLQVAAALIDYETASSHSITIGVTGVTPVIADSPFTIFVTDVAVTTPAAPVLLLTTPPTDTTPDFTLTGDLAINDVVRFQYSAASDFTGASELTNTIDAGEDAANTIIFTTGSLSPITWYFRARIERVEASPSGWSNVETVTIVSSAATTWNPADKTSNLTLSNSDRTVTYNTTGNQNANVRSVAPIVAGQKVYIEHVITAMVTNFGVGFCTIGTAFIGPASGIGTPSTAFGFGIVNGKFQCNDSINGTDNFCTPCAAGDRIGIAYNATTGRTWARKNGGAWNAAAGGAQDPVAGTGGAVVPAMGTMYVHAGLDANTGDALTTNFATASWVDAPPSGYTQVAA